MSIHSDARMMSQVESSVASTNASWTFGSAQTPGNKTFSDLDTLGTGVSEVASFRLKRTQTWYLGHQKSVPFVEVSSFQGSRSEGLDN